MIRPKRKQRIRQAACALCACAGLAASAATIGYVADGSAGPYCNRGYGIDVNVSVPATGCTVEYAESETGPWSTEPVTYTDVCTDRPVWFRLSAAGYDTVVDRALVTITPKALTDEHVWVEQDGEYVYDGTEKRPAPRFADPAARLTADDFDVIYRDNVNAGTARAVFTGKNNYTGTVEVEFEILKAENEWTTTPAVADWTYGQAASEPVSAAKSGAAVVTWSSGAKPTLPGNYTATFTVPESQNYNELTATVGFTVRAATIRYVADGNPPDSVYCSRGFGIEVNVSTPAAGCTVEYAESAEGPWSAEPVTYTDVCTDRPVWFRLSATGYATVVDRALVTIAPKPLTEDYVWVEEPSGGYVYDGTPKTPAARFGDGDPSILTENDFDVAYRDNVNAGTACAVFTGRNNYTGTVEVEFEIRRRQVTLTSGNGSWTHDGAAHAETTVTVGGDGFAPGEGATYGNFATASGAGSYSNTFDYTFDEGTRADNYDVTKVEGTLTVAFQVVLCCEWDDSDNAASLRPSGVSLTVRTNDVAMTTVAVSSADGWQTQLGFRVSGVSPSVDGTLASVLDGYDADVEAYGLSALGALTSSTTPLLTRTGWVSTGLLRPDDEVRTVTGWSRLGGLTLSSLVVVQEQKSGALLLMTGRLAQTSRRIVFDALGGRIGSAAAVTQEVSGAYGELPSATRAGYLLAGWFLGVTNGAPQATAGAALLADADHTLFAQWTVDPSVSPVIDADGNSVFRWEATGAETARILGFRDPNQRIANVVIPDKIEGRFVTAIGEGAFANSASGMADVVFPAFCTRIGARAFYNVTSLTSITFTDVRKWNDPRTSAGLTIGSYAFSSCLGLRELTVGESVGRIDDYAFLNCRRLAKIMILGKPSVGRQVFRSAGMDATPQGVEVLIDPALASDTDYMAALKGGMPSVTVREDAIVSSLKTQSVSLAPGRVTMTLSVRKASSWGAVDPASVKVRYWASLSEPAETLSPTAATDNGDGTLTVEVAVPEGNSGFLQAVME